ncbi:hypothetical protein [Streptococcus fryi]
MEIKNYKKVDNQVSYTIVFEDIMLDIIHTNTDYNSVETTDYYPFLEKVSYYNEVEADMIDKFISLQAEMLLEDIDFEWEVE